MAQDLLNLPTNQVLRNMTLPISIGMLSTILFQVVDTYFVGTLGPEPLTALSFSSTVYFLLIGLYIGIALSVSIMVGKSFGEGDLKQVRRITSVSLLLGFTISAIISLLGILTIHPLFTLLGANEVFLAHISSYMIPMYVGMPVLSLGLIAGSVIRSSGNVKPPEIIMGIAGIINVILDYLFIYGKYGFPKLGIAGVAYGTVISWVFVLVCMSVLLVKGKYLMSIAGSVSKNFTVIKSLYSLGIPSVVTQLVAPITLMFVIYLLGRQDPNAVAAFGVASRLETLLMVGIMAVGTAVTPFVAQNSGAKKVQRIDEAIVFSGKASFYLGIAVAIILLLFINPIASLFSSEQKILDYTAGYFYITAGSYILYGLYLVTGAIFNGLQQPKLSLKVMLTKTILFTAPLTVAGSWYGVTGIFIGLAVSHVLGGLYARIVMRKQLRKVGSSLVGRSPGQDMLLDIKRLFKFKM